MEGPPGFDTITLSGYAQVRGALTNNDLSRSLDYERFERGNLKEGTLSVLHGAEHRERRRMENKLFRRDMFELYEHELFPDVVTHTLDSFVDPVESDMMEIGGLISVVLACRTAGVDFDWNSIEDRQRLRYFLHQFALGGAIDSAKGDPETIKAQMREVFGDFRSEFMTESRENRATTVKRRTAGEKVDLLYDILTTLLVNQPTTAMTDDLIERESTLFFSAGAHTSTQTLTNTAHHLFEWCRDRPEDRRRVVEDAAFAQRCVHEALRVRPTNPGILRRALVDTEVAGRPVAKGVVCVLDTISANTDPEVYGADAHLFNPNRDVPDGVPPYGMSFGAGMHFCIGRTLAVGLPQRRGVAPGPSHLYGMVPIALQAVFDRGVGPHPDKPPLPDTKTRRWTRWLSYPVVFNGAE